jgi:hypothetical protein
VLLLLHTIRSLQRVEAGDVCQCIDGSTLQATNKVGRAPACLPAGCKAACSGRVQRCPAGCRR